jgi:hypothetical protein
VDFTRKLLLLTFGVTLFGIFVDIEIACFEETSFETRAIWKSNKGYYRGSSSVLLQEGCLA